MQVRNYKKNFPWEPEFAFWGTRQTPRGAGGFNSQNQPKRILDAFAMAPRLANASEMGSGAANTKILHLANGQ